MGAKQLRVVRLLQRRYRLIFVLVLSAVVLVYVSHTRQTKDVGLQLEMEEDEEEIMEGMESEDDEEEAERRLIKEVFAEQEREQLDMPTVEVGNATFVRDVSLENTACYKQVGGNRRFCVPSLIIGGLQRTGWRVLYMKMMQHGSMVGKEEIDGCPEEDTVEEAWRWFEREVQLGKHRRHARLVSGCSEVLGMENVMGEVDRLGHDVGFVFVVRNFADWAFSRFRNECWEEYDGKCGGRGLEEWQKVVKEGHKAFRFLQQPLAVFRPRLEEVLKLGEERVLVVRQEDIENKVGRVLAAVARLAEVGDEAFAEEAYQLVTGMGEVYVGAQREEVDMGRIREVLDDMWKGECLWLRQEVGIIYDEVC